MIPDLRGFPCLLTALSSSRGRRTTGDASGRTRRKGVHSVRSEPELGRAPPVVGEGGRMSSSASVGPTRRRGPRVAHREAPTSVRHVQRQAGVGRPPRSSPPARSCSRPPDDARSAGWRTRSPLLRELGARQRGHAPWSGHRWGPGYLAAHRAGALGRLSGPRYRKPVHRRLPVSSSARGGTGDCPGVQLIVTNGGNQNRGKGPVRAPEAQAALHVSLGVTSVHVTTPT